jgi:hypothetical protein
MRLAHAMADFAAVVRRFMTERGKLARAGSLALGPGDGR